MEPNFISLQPVTVAYLQERGDYNITGPLAFKKLIDHFPEKNVQDIFQSIYGMGLDNPTTTKSEECRFDACVKMAIEYDSELPACLQKKEIEGGNYAVFIHKGSYEKLGAFCNKIFQDYFPQDKIYAPSFGPLFCEYTNFFEKSDELKETKVHVPIKNKYLE